MNRITQIHRIALFVLLGLTAIGCKVTAEDVEYWRGTVKGPGKIVAVMTSDKYPIELRTRAALALVEMEPRQEVDGIKQLQHTLGQLDGEIRGQIIAGLATGLSELMKADDADASGAEGPSALQVRAKDAAYLLVNQAQGDNRNRLADAVVAWFAVDFNGRSLAGNYSAEQVIRSLGSRAAQQLVEALSAEMPQTALVKLAELIAAAGDDKTREAAGKRLVAIEKEMEGSEFMTWLKAKVADSMKAQDESAKLDDKRIAKIAEINRENFINGGALPAMKHLASEKDVAARLIEIAELNSTTPTMVERRTKALQALEGHAKPEHQDALLKLALSSSSPTSVRDYAFDRIGDIRSKDAIPPMWPLVQDGSQEGQRLRWRAGELVLAIGGAEVLGEFFAKLPESDNFLPEELEGYATRMSQMTPPPTRTLTAQLSSPNWWNRVIALRYLERKGEARDVRKIRRLSSDKSAIPGNKWSQAKLSTVGDVATQAMKALKERLAEDKSES